MRFLGSVALVLAAGADVAAAQVAPEPAAVPAASTTPTGVVAPAAIPPPPEAAPPRAGSRRGAADDELPSPQRRNWDAAIGFVSSYAPEYAGSNRWSVGVQPGGWVRWGRLSIASRSSFVVRSGEPLASSGLRLDLSPGERLRIGLSLRQDSGRQESDSADLRGLGDVRPTLRVRLAASYPMDGVRLGASVTTDALGRGGGELADLSLSRSTLLAPRLSGSVGVAVVYGSARYMQAYYGITEEQAVRSGYAVYMPGAGLRDVNVAFGLRHELEGPWVLFGGASASRIIDKAAGSPLTRERNSWALSAGLAYRF